MEQSLSNPVQAIQQSHTDLERAMEIAAPLFLTRIPPSDDRLLGAEGGRYPLNQLSFPFLDFFVLFT